MSENKWLRRTAAVLTAILMIVPCAGCTGETSADTGKTGNSASGSSDTGKKAVSLNEDQKKAAEEAGISEDRYCTDNSEITKVAEELLKQYCDGMTEADHEKCFGAFPDFYRKAVEDENKQYGETNEQYMKSIKDGFAESYGDDFYIFATVSSVLQLSDESLKSFKERIDKSFEIDANVEDLYYVYFTENVRGSKNKSSDELEFILPVIDGKTYLYDDYYEVYEEATPADAVAGEQAAAKENEEKADAKKAEDSAS